MGDIDEVIEDLKRMRDELRVKVNLASKDIQDEWRELEAKMKDFRARAELDKTGEGIGGAMSQLGQELKQGYKRIRKAMKED